MDFLKTFSWLISLKDLNYLTTLLDYGTVLFYKHNSGPQCNTLTLRSTFLFDFLCVCVCVYVCERERSIAWT